MIFSPCSRLWISILSNFIANWTAPPHVRALTTTRSIGVSDTPFHHNNIALHVGDNEAHVLTNRASLIQSLELLNEPIWLEQTHSTRCIVVEDSLERSADASITRCHNVPLSIMTADCVPIVLCNRAGTEIAAIHAGWKGLVNGIVENTLAKMNNPADTLIAWIGPSICQSCYAVGSEMKNTYIQRYPFTENTFQTDKSQIFANLPKMAELILKNQGVSEVFQSGACTYELKNEFYSYRRQAQTGRMVTLIWMNPLNVFNTGL